MSRLTKKIGKRIADARKQKQLTQEDLAGLSNLNVSYISAVECGRYSVGIDNLHKITKALEITFIELFQGY